MTTNRHWHTNRRVGNDQPVNTGTYSRSESAVEQLVIQTASALAEFEGYRLTQSHVSAGGSGLCYMGLYNSDTGHQVMLSAWSCGCPTGK